MPMEYLSNDNLIESHTVNSCSVAHCPTVQSLDQIFSLGETVSETGFEVLSKVLSFSKITASSTVRKLHGHSVDIGDLLSCVKDICFRIA